MEIFGIIDNCGKILEENCPWTYSILKWIGIIWCVIMITDKVWAFYRYCLRKPYNIFARYGGSDIWAVITGASDGIGFEYCMQLSRIGFNILMIARSKTKLESKKLQILELCHKKIEVETVEMDFNVQFSETTYAPAIRAIKEKKIGLLINNVGAVFAQDFHNFPEEKLLEILNVNIEAVTFMTRLVLPGMVERAPHKCAIIGISSALGQFAVPYAGVYVSCKSYMSYFLNSLALEYKDSNIDFLNCLTGKVHTKLSPTKTNTHLTTQETVEGQLRCLGKDSESFGSYKHALFSLPLLFKAVRNQIGNRFKTSFSSLQKSKTEHLKKEQHSLG